MNRGRSIKDRTRVWVKLNMLAALITAVLFTSFLSPISYTATETISITPLSIKLGDVGRATIMIDHLPNGLSGYIITLSLSKTGIAVISGVVFDAFAGANKVNISPDGGSVTLSAIDTEDVVRPGATDVELAQVEFRGIAEGESVVHIVVNRMDDDDGNVIHSQASDGTLKVITNEPPVADFSFSPLEPTDLDMIKFQDQSTDPDGRIIFREWDFGDGTTSTERNPSHKYTVDGVYQVSLTVTDNDGATGTVTKSISVSNVTPIARFTFSPSRPKANEEVTFNASASVDLDGQIAAYEWDWNSDGFFEARTLSPIINHSFNYCGIYTVTLKVTDNDGASNSTRHAVRANCPPTAKYTFWPKSPKPGQSITFDASSSRDPDGSSITRYEWDWNGDGRFDYSTSSPRANHLFIQAGTYKVILRVTDDDGAVATAIQRIQVKNPPKPPPTPPEDWENEEEVEEYFKQLIEYLFEEYPLIMWPIFIIVMLIGLLISASE